MRSDVVSYVLANNNLAVACDRCLALRWSPSLDAVALLSVAVGCNPESSMVEAAVPSLSQAAALVSLFVLLPEYAPSCREDVGLLCPGANSGVAATPAPPPLETGVSSPCAASHIWT